MSTSTEISAPAGHEPRADVPDGSTPPRGRPGRRRDLVAYLFLAPWFVGPAPAHRRPVLVALPVVHRLRPAQPRRAGSGWPTTCSMFTDDPRFLPVAQGHAHLRRARRSRCSWPSPWPWRCCSTAGCAGSASTASVYYLPSLLGGSVAVAVMWRQLFGGDGAGQPAARAASASRAAAGSPTPDYALYTLIAADDLAVRLADGDLPGRAASRSRRSSTTPPRSTAPAAGGSSGTSRCRC